MPVSLSYPGVYIEELPSGVHTITGVATSIAAFIGWAAQGPTDQAVLVESWGEYQSQFGGLDSRSYLGYAVSQFFINGGQQAYIVRLVAITAAATTGTGALGATTAPVVANATMNVSVATSATDDTLESYVLPISARNPGLWGNSITVSVTVPAKSSRFALQVRMNGSVVENFVNLSFDKTDPQYVVTVINSDSQYISLPATLADPTSSTVGSSGPTALMNGTDGTPLVPNDGRFENAVWSNNITAPVATYLLDHVAIFNLLCVPGEHDGQTLGVLQQFCASKRAFLIVDAPQVTPHSLASTGPAGSTSGLLTSGPYAGNSAFYYPWVLAADPLSGNRPKLMPPCGVVAGIYAQTDASRGVWKAPAGIDAALTGTMGLQYILTDQENGDLNVQGINCLRQFRVYGNVVWGSRTLLGNDQAGSEWKYVPIRRLALFIESSLYDGTQWVVFEPNDETLWGQIRMNVGAFMQGLFIQGAFQGTTPQQAYFVKCDSENNPQSSIDLGIVNVLVGFAPVYPAEFVVVQIQQIAGQV